MNDDLYDLYKRDQDFKDYVDGFCKKHDLGTFEAFNIYILREYAKEVKKRTKEREV